MSDKKRFDGLTVSLEEFASKLIEAAKAYADKPENREMVERLGGRAKAVAFLLSSCHDKSFNEIK